MMRSILPRSQSRSIFRNSLRRFMDVPVMPSSIQNTGIGSGIIDDLCRYLTEIRLSSVRLGWVKGNPQAEHFWRKNNFKETGITHDTDCYTVVVAQRTL